MPALVSLELAKLQLRITDTDHDADIELRRQQATGIVLDYLGAAADPAWDETTLPFNVQQAILVWVSHLFERGQVTTAGAGHSPEDAAVWETTWRLLRRLRLDVIA